ncbi:MAG: class I SAM-dependent methyltransferase [Hyphomicrobiaceae bacterium]
MYLRDVPSYSDLSQNLAWEKRFAAEKERRATKLLGRISTVLRWRLWLGDFFKLFVPQKRFTGAVLDIGCGGGCRIPEGPTPYGIEISQALATTAAPAFAARGGSVIHGPALDGLRAFPPGHFTAIFMRSYLEHEAMPRRVLAKCYDLLTPGGIIYVRVPNFGGINRRIMGRRWCGFRFPDHVNYFDEASLKRLSRSVGFSYRRTNGWSPLDDNLIVMLCK